MSKQEREQRKQQLLAEKNELLKRLRALDEEEQAEAERALADRRKLLWDHLAFLVDLVPEHAYGKKCGDDNLQTDTDCSRCLLLYLYRCKSDKKGQWEWPGSLELKVEVSGLLEDD